MAPPLKRRKLSSLDTHDAAYAEHTTTTSGLSPNDAYPSEFSLALDSSIELGGLQEAPLPQLMRDGVIEHNKVLVPRQISVSISVSSATLPSIPSPTLPFMLSPTLTSVTITSASIPAATIPAGVTPTDSSSPSSASTSSPTSTPPTSTTSTTSTTSATSLTSSLTSLTSVSTSTISSTTSSTTTDLSTSTSTSISTGTSTHSSSSTTHSPTTHNPASTDSARVFLATLPNGETTTITRPREQSIMTSSYVETQTDSAVSTTQNPGTTTLVDTFYTTLPNGMVVSISTATSLVQASSSSSAPATTTTATLAEQKSNDTSAPAPGTIAGGVVGGAAGLAVVLLIAMLFVRWYRRKGNGDHRALPAGSLGPRDYDEPSGPSGPGMAERAGLVPLMAAVPTLFRYQTRSSASSPKPLERGFTRVSGRKLPSAFSEGMSSDAMTSAHQQSSVPLNPNGAGLERNLTHTSSSYLDGDSYEYASTISPSSPTAPASLLSSSAPVQDSVQERLMMSPGPQRQPQFHQVGQYRMTPGGRVIAGPRAPDNTLLGGRDTPPSLRNSRFTEEM